MKKQNDQKGYQCRRCDAWYQERTTIARHNNFAHPVMDDEKEQMRDLFETGCSFREIGDQLNRAPDTVKRHLFAILGTLPVQAAPPEEKINKNIQLIVGTFPSDEPPPAPVVDAGMYTPAEYVLAFEARVAEFHALLAKKDARIFELSKEFESKEKEANALAKELNELLYRGQSFRQQMQTADSILRSPLAR
jgi:uncharacterized coiled-coil protein SlyX